VPRQSKTSFTIKLLLWSIYLQKQSVVLVDFLDCTVGQDGTLFRAIMRFAPYFFVGVRENMIREVENYLRRKFDDINKTEHCEKEDLAMVWSSGSPSAITRALACARALLLAQPSLCSKAPVP